ncbi:MAG: DNA-binding protein [Bacillota bacterium]|nr:DNA-binding protein [Bacillota bacterium]
MRNAWFVLPVAVAVWVAATASPAVALSSAELIGEARRHDGREVVYRGEVVGDVMRRGRWAVINLHDGSNALGVWLPARLAGEIELTGRYGVTGDTVEVRGSFHRACPVHGGDLDLHAESLTVVERGKRERLPFRRRRAALAGGLCLVALGLALWERQRKVAECDGGLS